jgi:hypothetical protein
MLFHSCQVRTRAAGQYQFSMDEAERAKQRASLDAQREETSQQRSNARLGQVQAAKKRQLDLRRAEIDAKRARLLGGQQKVDELRAAKREAQVNEFLSSFEKELHE